MPGGWRTAHLVARRQETMTAATLVLQMDAWPGHVAGQHIDLRLTADDGYQASRSYSLAGPARAADSQTTAPEGRSRATEHRADIGRIEITVQRVPGGEVSPFLVDEVAIEDTLEVRGPLGGWFIWRPEDPTPVLLLAGGSGVVPLMSMIRSRQGANSTPFRLIYSVRTPSDRLYAAELGRRTAEEAGLRVHYVYTRRGAEDASRHPRRLDAHDVGAHGWSPRHAPHCYVCGPTGFVEAATRLLVEAGHDPERVRTERFGGP